MIHIIHSSVKHSLNKLISKLRLASLLALHISGSPLRNSIPCPTKNTQKDSDNPSLIHRSKILPNPHHNASAPLRYCVAGEKLHISALKSNLPFHQKLSIALRICLSPRSSRKSIYLALTSLDCLQSYVVPHQDLQSFDSTLLSKAHTNRKLS